MHDALGIGLAAPQVGISHRLLVYRVEPDSPIVALVNPEIEWSSRDEEIAEEGCLSLPLVHVDVERPIGVLVRAQDEHGDDLIVEASGLEARVIQHEIDHLDGVLILDRTTREQRKAAMRALREAEQAARPRRVGRRANRLPRHVGVRGRGADPPRGHRPPAAARRHPPGPPGRPRAQARRRRRSRERGARRSASSSSSRDNVNEPTTRARRSPPREPEVVAVCAFGALHQGAAAVRPRADQRPPVAAAALARRGARRAGDHGRRRARPASARCSPRPASTPAPSTSPAPSRSTPTTRTARSPRACEQLGADLLIRTLDERPAARPAARGGRDVRRQDRPRRPHARPRRDRPRSTTARCAR